MVLLMVLHLLLQVLSLLLLFLRHAVEGINYYGLSTSLAAAVGPFLGILMLHSLGYDLSSHSVLTYHPLRYWLCHHEI